MCFFLFFNNSVIFCLFFHHCTQNGPLITPEFFLFPGLTRSTGNILYFLVLPLRKSCSYFCFLSSQDDRSETQGAPQVPCRLHQGVQGGLEGGMTPRALDLSWIIDNNIYASAFLFSVVFLNDRNEKLFIMFHQ